MSEWDFGVIIIEGGGAGYAAATIAAELGRPVAKGERWKLGGTCLTVGCMPAKTLPQAIEVAETIRRASEFGILVGEMTIDFPAVMDGNDRIIMGFSGEDPDVSEVQAETFSGRGILSIQGGARALEPADGQPCVVAALASGHFEHETGVHVLPASGRQPRCADLDVERFGDVASPDGISVTAALTNGPRVRAAGSVTGPHMYPRQATTWTRSPAGMRLTPPPRRRLFFGWCGAGSLASLTLRPSGCARTGHGHMPSKSR